MTDNLIILAGGASSRMKKSDAPYINTDQMSQANSRSKALITLHDRPMLDYVFFNAKKAGIKNIYIVISPNATLFQSYFGTKKANNRYHGLNISYVTQHIPSNRTKPLGTADAVLQAIDQYPNLKKTQFLLCNCDNLYSTNAMINLNKATAANAMINYDRAALKFSTERIVNFALTKTNTKNYLIDIIEKPHPERIEAYRDVAGKFRVSMNLFKFDGSAIYPFLYNCPLHPSRSEKELPTAILNMINNSDHKMQTIPMAEHVPDLTSKSDISLMNDYITAEFKHLDWN